MGLYFFDVFDGRSWHRDNAGEELHACEVADQATALLPELARDALLRHAVRRLAISVRDAHGHFVYSASLTFDDCHAQPEGPAPAMIQAKGCCDQPAA